MPGKDGTPLARLRQVADPDRPMPTLARVGELHDAAQKLGAQLQVLCEDLAELDHDASVSTEERRAARVQARESAAETLAELRAFGLEVGV